MKGAYAPHEVLQSQSGVQRDVLGRGSDLDREISQLRSTDDARNHAARRQDAAADYESRASQSSNRADGGRDVALKAIV